MTLPPLAFSLPAGVDLADPLAVFDATVELLSSSTPGYLFGGGHEVPLRTLVPGQPMDCSASTCLALYAAGLFHGEQAVDSGVLEVSWGEPGEGSELTVWANVEHVYVERRGASFVRFDTGGPDGVAGEGPKARSAGRSSEGFVARRAPGL